MIAAYAALWLSCATSGLRLIRLSAYRAVSASKHSGIPVTSVLLCARILDDSVPLHASVPGRVSVRVLTALRTALVGSVKLIYRLLLTAWRVYVEWHS